jgi:2-polyprenyl-3-methyl-5-hydroxy-6-metoxy-1,4-benzoquinol methylase
MVRSMRCRFCAGQDLQWLIHDVLASFYRCRNCGCDSSDRQYDDVKHTYFASDYVACHERFGTRFDDLLVHCSTNIDTLNAATVPEKSVLDVGCLEGAAMKRLTTDGWDVWGFDVIPEVPLLVSASTGVPVGNFRVAPEFTASLFPKQFGAILSREVIEHVPDVRSHMKELLAATLPGGVIQIQTPRPCDPQLGKSVVYQDAHLLLMTPDALQMLLREHGLVVETSLIWDRGHYYQARKTT